MSGIFRYLYGLTFLTLSLPIFVFSQVCQPFDLSILTNSKVLQQPVSFIQLDSAKNNMGGTNDKDPLYAGYSVPFSKDYLSHRTWNFLKADTYLWKIGITVPGASALNLYFEHFNLHPDEKVIIYDPKMDHVLGALTDSNNGRFLGTVFLQTDSLIIGFITYEKKEKVPFSLSEVGISTKSNGNSNRDFGDSGDCEVLVNCPEGDNYQNEKRGVTRILVKEGASLFWCSGSLVNNTNRDGAPYLLTAHHCGKNASADDYSKWLFYFNFESDDCEIPLLEPENQSMSGAKLVADGQSTNSGSDFKLLLLNENVPKNYYPYFNGWDRSTIPSENGVGIHHPEGDLKMISTFQNTVVSTNYNNTEPDEKGQFWQVYWSETSSGHGVTEGGSSGSPIFNSDGYIVGTLSGGRASCNHLDLPDYYGKFSEHWESNGADSTAQLKYWLDPIGSDLPALRGLDLDSSKIKADFDSYNTHIRVGDGVQFNNKSIGNISDYKWEFKGGEPEFSESAIPPIIHYRKIGEFDVKLTVKSAVDTDSLIIKNYVRVLPNLYPNPSKDGMFNLVFGEFVPSDIEINVYNPMGQLLQFDAYSASDNIITLNLRELPQGVYLVKVKSNGNIQTLKVGNKIISH